MFSSLRSSLWIRNGGQIHCKLRGFQSVLDYARQVQDSGVGDVRVGKFPRQDEAVFGVVDGQLDQLVGVAEGT